MSRDAKTHKFGKAKHIHFVGIGGIGMSGIAELLMNLGYEVSGSDLKETAITRRLASMGGRIHYGHHAENIKGADVVVYSSAVKEDNPEILEAKERYIPVIPRAEMLAELMRLKFGIAVAGAHGKTTTTSMIASILNHAHLDPTVVIGGRLDIWGGSNARLGEGEILLAEADESDGSFLVLSPNIVVVTNLDMEHVDFYQDMEDIRQTFVEFINKIPFYGTAVICLDNQEIQGIIPRLRKRYITYGLSAQADLMARDLEKGRYGVEFEVVWRGDALGRVEVGMPGEHNVLNALAAIGVGMELELDFHLIAGGLKNLGGLARRFQIKGEVAGIVVMDDYGHHPTEIVATLKTLRESWPDRRLVVVFQPHRHTRTKALFEQFTLSFNQADLLLVLPIYGAGETPFEGITGQGLAKAIKERGHKEVISVNSKEEALSVLQTMVRSGDLVLTLGAGDVYKVADELLQKLPLEGSPPKP
ncbi:MAG TPA: UDP-N-acetylmuramate--L-alanine ligase [Desulfobacterales bacterium]|nr:UDP-N-acetylmuramate--L-alanine ligase [Desulfobacterales bacterium]